jgi:hypothetical protein
MAKGERALLPPEEEQRLTAIAASGPGLLQQRAKVVLAWHEGLTAAETSKRLRISENQVRYLLKLYRQKGLDLFLVDSAPIKAPSAAPEPEPEPESQGILLDDLCEAHHVDLAHAGYVESLAGAIFGATTNVHRLPASLHTLLDAAVLLHNITFADNPVDHHLHGRDLILATPIRGFTDEERHMLACMTAFHRGKVLPDREPAYLELPEDLRRDTLALAAILRVADGLDNSKTQGTHITGVQVMIDTLLITVDGPDSVGDAAYAESKGDLWAQVFGMKVRIVAHETRPTLITLPKLSPTIKSDMTIARAGRVFTAHTLTRLEGLLSGIRKGDLSLLPGLAREAARLCEAIGLAELPKPLVKEARWLKDTTEDARLEWVIGERIAGFADNAIEDSSRTSAEARAQDWDNTAKTTIEALNTERFSSFTEGLREAIAAAENEDSPQDKAQIAFHAGEILFGYVAILRDVMDSGTSVTDALDAARRLQDHLIALRDLLGSEAAQVIDMIAPFEGFLAAIHTTQAIVTRLEPKPIKKGRKTIPPEPDPLMDAIRAVQMDALESLADSLPAAWNTVSSPVFRRALALAIAVP